MGLTKCDRDTILKVWFGYILMQDLEAQCTSYGVILSRQGFVQKEELEHFARHGTCCYIVKCDVAYSTNTDGVIGWVHEHLPIIGKMVHAAGLLGYGNIQDMTTSSFWLLALPKVRMQDAIYAPSADVVRHESLTSILNTHFYAGHRKHVDLQS